MMTIMMMMMMRRRRRRRRRRITKIMQYIFIASFPCGPKTLYKKTFLLMVYENTLT